MESLGGAGARWLFQPLGICCLRRVPVYQKDQGAMIEGKATVQDRLVADVELFYAFLDESSRAKKLFEPKNFVFTMRILGVFDVGKSAEGNPLIPPGLENFHQAADESSLASPEE